VTEGDKIAEKQAKIGSEKPGTEGAR